jgi:DNA-binding response OmpR family regulator
MISAVTPSHQPTVLLVEDDELVRDAMYCTLVQEGYLVQTAATGHDAIGLLKTPLSPIDVVLLDVKLPDVSGIDLCAALASARCIPTCRWLSAPARRTPTTWPNS